MSLKSDQEFLAYAAFDLWMNRQLEKLVNQWIEWAAPIDRDTWVDPFSEALDPAEERLAKPRPR